MWPANLAHEKDNSAIQFCEYPSRRATWQMTVQLEGVPGVRGGIERTNCATLNTCCVTPDKDDKQKKLQFKCT